jgi:group I intron endonuclease
MTKIFTLSILLTQKLNLNAVSALLLEPIRDISVIFNGIGFSLGLAIIGWAMIVLLLLTYFIINDDIGLKGGSLYTTNMKQTFHMFIIYMSNMLQVNCSSLRPSPSNRACGSNKIKSFNSLNSCFVHALFSPSQSLFRSRIRISSYSTDKPAVIPVKIYMNADIDKLQILKENQGKAGVYRWGNLVNGKTYIGSSINLSRRFRDYYSIRLLEREVKRTKSSIYPGLLKYGYSNFSLEILEYCDKSETISREQYYLDLLNPDYNILKIAGSSLGYKHSPETKAKMKDRIWSEEHKAEHLERLKRLHVNPEHRAKRLEQLNHLNSSPEHEEQLNRLHLSMKGRARPEGKPSVSIEVFDTLTDKITIYPSISEAARAIGGYQGRYQ